MKNIFSTRWIRSKQPRKQRKWRYNAPLHVSQKLMSATLSKELRKKYKRRSASVRKGDTVLVMRGSFAKKEGKVSIVDLKKRKITLEGIQRSKKDGTKIPVLFDPSKVIIKQLALEDKERIASLEKKSNGEKQHAPKTQ